MGKITNLEEVRLSMLDHDELLVKAIEKSTEQIGTHTRVLKDLSRRLLNLERLVHIMEVQLNEIDQGLEDYR